MNAYELAAVMAGKQTFARLLERRRAAVVVDNTVKLHSLVKGDARKGDRSFGGPNLDGACRERHAGLVRVGEKCG